MKGEVNAFATLEVRGRTTAVCCKAASLGKLVFSLCLPSLCRRRLTSMRQGVFVCRQWMTRRARYVCKGRLFWSRFVRVFPCRPDETSGFRGKRRRRGLFPWCQRIRMVLGHIPAANISPLIIIPIVDVNVSSADDDGSDVEAD
jgi:hypothetical protein